MTYEELINWFDLFENEIVTKRKLLRGYVFSGARIEVFSDGGVSIVLTPGVRGKTKEERSWDAYRQLTDESPDRELFIDLERIELEKVVRGERIISETDWTWTDEE